MSCRWPHGGTGPLRVTEAGIIPSHQMRLNLLSLAQVGLAQRSAERGVYSHHSATDIRFSFLNDNFAGSRLIGSCPLGVHVRLEATSGTRLQRCATITEVQG